MSRLRWRDLFLGGLCALTWPSALLAWGWLARTLRAEAEEQVTWLWPPRALWANVTLGLQCFLTATVGLLPSLGLLQVAWIMGWQNSFHKGYELAGVGPGLSLLGMILFGLSMIYVPMAQMHQIQARTWRAFFDVSAVLATVQHRWLGLLLWSATFVVLAVPTFMPRALLAFVGNHERPAGAVYGLTLVACFLGFGAFAWLRVWLCRLYRQPHTTTPGRLRWLGLTLQVPIWLVYTVLLYITQFFHYVPGRGFLLQPLLHIPWFHPVS